MVDSTPLERRLDTVLSKVVTSEPGNERSSTVSSKSEAVEDAKTTL